MNHYSLCICSRFLFRLFFLCIICLFLACCRLLRCSTLWRSSLRLIRFSYNLLFRFHFCNPVHIHFITWFQTFSHNPVVALRAGGRDWTWCYFTISTDQHRHCLTCWSTGQRRLWDQEGIGHFTLYDLRRRKHTWQEEMGFVREYST